MARVPTLTRRITPSGRVTGVTIPSDIADTGQGIEAQGLQFLGRSIADIGNLLAELSERERKADDLLASDSAGIARQSAADSYLQFKEDNKDPKLWNDAAKRFRNDADEAFEKLQFFDPQRKERETIRHEAEMNHFEAIAQLQVTDAKSKIAVTATIDSFVSAFANNSSDLAAKEKDLDEALLNEFGEELAAVRKKEILAIAEKQQIENVKKDLMNRAAIRPDLMKSFIDAELEARAKGKKAIDEFELLSNTDLEGIRDYSNSVGEKVVSDSRIAADAAVKASYRNIINGGTDITEMASLILVDPTITDDDKTKAVDKIKTFFTTWNSAIKKEEEKVDIVTSNSTRIKALRIIKAVKTGKLTDDEGLEVYETLSKIEEINGTDGKQFINDIFAAGEAARSVEKRRQNDILAGREKQLRDAIEKQQNILQPDLATEILKDFANIAVIELNDAFREGDFTKKEVDAEVDRLLNRFTLSEAQQQMAVNARSLRLAKSLKEQQESITKLVASLRAEGKEDAAKRVMDDAIRLGIFISEGGTIKKGKKKTSVGRELIKRILDSIIE